MSIKIEGDGNKENVFSDSDSGMPLWNGTPFGLLPPDLSKEQENIIADISPTGVYINNPFTVPEDGWILSFICEAADDLYSTIDGIGTLQTTPSQIVVEVESLSLKKVCLNCPYPVKKGQVVESSGIAPNVYIIFAPCMSV